MEALVKGFVPKNHYRGRVREIYNIMKGYSRDIKVEEQDTSNPYNVYRVIINNHDPIDDFSCECTPLLAIGVIYEGFRVHSKTETWVWLRSFRP